MHGDPRDVILSQFNQCRGECAGKGLKECYKCFTTDPQYDEPSKMAACVDLLQKRRPPTLHETDYLTPRNARRVCIVREDLKSASMLSVADAERLMGFPEGWTRARGCLTGLGSAKVHAELRRQDTETDSPKDTSMVGDMPRRNLVKKCNNLIAPDSANDVLGTHYSTKENFRRGSGDERDPRFSFAKLCSPASASVEFYVQSANVKTDTCSSAEYIEHEVSGGEIDEESMITPEEASRIIRMFLLVTASAVPMAKWIGDKLNNPYNVKFQNWQLGIPFHKEIIGGLDAPEGRAWPRAAWNVLPSSRAGTELEHMVWNGRHALRDCSDTPLCVPFVPLGEFLPHNGVAPSKQAASAYVTALQISHFDIPDFVINILDPCGAVTTANALRRGSEKPHCTDLIRLENLAELASAEPSIFPSMDVGKDELQKPDEQGDGCSNDDESGFGSTVGTQFSGGVSPAENEKMTMTCEGEPPFEYVLSGEEDESNRDDPFLAGRPVWAPWKLGKGADNILWPGISLHRERNKEIIPDAALKMKVKGSSANSHQLVIFFGDRTYQWLPTSSLINFRDARFKECMNQNVKRYAATFQRACEEARVWFRTWQSVQFQNHDRSLSQQEQGNPPYTEGAGAKPDTENTITRSAHRNGSAERFERFDLDTCKSKLLPGQNMAVLPHISGGTRLLGIVSSGPVSYAGALGSSAEPEPCGFCRICHSRTTAAMRAATLSDVKHNIQRHLKCPQIHIVQMARTGHMGALLALRRENAIGIRIMLLMDPNGIFSCGKISSFDSTRFSHDVKFDDGVVATRLKLWDESIQILEKQSNPSSHAPVAISFHAAEHAKLGLPSREVFTKMISSAEREMKLEKDDDDCKTIRKRKAPDVPIDVLGSAGVRCESCARSHKGIAYCIARGHNRKSVSKAKTATLSSNAQSTIHEFKAEAMPRATVRRGGNGKFVVSESVGAALATAGVEIPERCPLCIRRKKGLAHCLKKGHIAGAETAAAMIVPDSLTRWSNKGTSTTRKLHEDIFGAALTESQQTIIPASDTQGLRACQSYQDSGGITQNNSVTTQAIAAAAMAAAFARAAGRAPVPVRPANSH